MKFELKRLTDYSKKSIIEEINRVDKLLNKEILKATDIKKYSKVGLTTIRRKFGSLEMAYMEAGIGYKYPSKYVNKKVNTGKSKRLTNEEIISELQRLAGNKKIITVEELRNNCPLFGYELVLSRFGTWKNALRLAELEIGKHAIRYTNNECFENLLTVWTYYGNIPKYRDMNLPPSVVGGKAYLSKWGTWNKALQAFINFVTKEPNNTAPTTLHEQTPSSTSNYKSKTEQDRHEIKLSLRYKVLVRDNFKCVRCGASPSTDLGCKLVVDHKIPFSLGGKTIFDNLETKCAACNLGKGNKYIEN